MRGMVVVFLVFVLASGVSAQLNPDPDVISVYFDTTGTMLEMFTVAPFQHVTAYLLITNPTDVVGIGAWEASVEVTGPSIVPAWTVTSGVDSDPSDSGFKVEIGVGPSCLPSEPVVHVATWTAYIVSPTDALYFTVSGHPDSNMFGEYPGYLGGSEEQTPYPLDVPGGFPFVPVACINCNWSWPQPVGMFVQLTYGNGTMTGPACELGFRNDSQDGLDPYDVPATPLPVSDYMRLVFPHPEWGDPAGSDYSADYRGWYSPYNSSKSWFFRVETDQLYDPVLLTFDMYYSYGLPDHVRLVDLKSGQHVIDTNDNTLQYQFMPAPDGVNEFEFIIGMPDGPTTVDPDYFPAVLEAGPNPFNPVTSLSFVPPITGSAAIRIHDASGRLVTTVDAGVAEEGVEVRASWRGRDGTGREVPSGMYFAVPVVGGRVVGEACKLTLVR